MKGNKPENYTDLPLPNKLKFVLSDRSQSLITNRLETLLIVTASPPHLLKEKIQWKINTDVNLVNSAAKRVWVSLCP